MYRKQRILLVDDDDSIRMLYSLTLSDAGFEVRTASDGKAALEMLGSFTPDLIVLDLVMPEQEGIETILELRRLQSKIPVIAISGATGANGYLQVANLLGAGHTLTKPIKAGRLVAAIRSILGSESAAAGS